MLIKDISLKDAIGDLVDNSVDAIKAKSKNQNDFSGYTIEITADNKIFSIKDNGSGIEEDIARKYAFKLGKPKDHKLLKHSIGRFGIGMKRAFFKIGNEIFVESIAPKSRFTITTDALSFTKQVYLFFDILNDLIFC
jgi:HSP90 family molecular chaperone